MTIGDNTSTWKREITRFGSGPAGRRPDSRTTQAANQLARAAVELTLEHEAYLDDADGTLGFMLRLNNGLLLLLSCPPTACCQAAPTTTGKAEADRSSSSAMPASTRCSN